jgi:hypothetical protein
MLLFAASLLEAFSEAFDEIILDEKCKCTQQKWQKRQP